MALLLQELYPKSVVRKRIDVNIDFPTTKRRKPAQFRVQDSCLKLKQGQFVITIDGVESKVEVNDKKLHRLQLNNKWISYLKVKETEIR